MNVSNDLEIIAPKIVLSKAPISARFFSNNYAETKRWVDPRAGEDLPHGIGWANVHTWFDFDWFCWTSRIVCCLPGKKIWVLEVDAQTEKEAIENAIICVGNLQ